jgi:hypothetical protein
MRKRHGLVAAVATVAVTASIAPSADAKIVPVKRTSKGATALARAIAVKPRLVKRAIWSTVPPRGVPGAVSTTSMARFPRVGRSFGILSTGDARFAHRKNSRPNTGRANLGPLIRGGRDVAILRIYVRVPKNASCLSVRFRFLSEEYPEFVKDIFNDTFIAELDSSTWDASGPSDPTVTSPDNFATTADGRPIRVNATGDTAVAPSRARGTTYDAATRLLRASTSLTPGTHSLYLSIFDQGDRQYDSAVFLDKLTIDRRHPCTSGAVVEGK